MPKSVARLQLWTMVPGLPPVLVILCQCGEEILFCRKGREGFTTDFYRCSGKKCGREFEIVVRQ